MLKKSAFSLVALMASCFLLTACNKYVADTDKKIETTLERIEEYNLQAQVPSLPEPTDTVRVHNDIWLGNESMKIMEGDALPAWLEKEDSITIAISKDETLPEVIQEISDLTNIPVRLDDLKTTDTVPEDAIPVRYSGKLSGLLNYLAGRYGVYWRYKDRTINFFANETRIFTIYALPTETSLQAQLTGATMGETAGGGNASSSLSTSANLALWDNIEEGVKQVAGDNAKLSFSRVAGTVSVTASPYIIQKVAKYIANWNEKLSRQVAITVRILQVTLTNTDNYGLDLVAAFQNSKFIMSSVSPFSMMGDAGTAGSLSMTLLKPKKFANSNAMIQALSTQGKVRQLNSASITAMNNKVAPIQITTSENYVKKSTVTTNGTGDNQSRDTDLDVDTLTYGFTMDILPRILDHGRLIIMFSLTMTDLLDLQQFNSQTGLVDESSDNGNENDNSQGGESTMVQLPKMAMRGFMQEIAMTSGSTLVLSGFERIKDSTATSGIGKAKMGLLGGNAYNHNEREVLVLLMTPEVLQSPLSQEALMRDY
ncbi:MAG: hypothetical protein II938_00460 [Alphaproteobacteria bacterium]|nr:hypothetical protein [Alphaproteobacteria bacterium]